MLIPSGAFRSHFLLSCVHAAELVINGHTQGHLAIFLVVTASIDVCILMAFVIRRLSCGRRCRLRRRCRRRRRRSLPFLSSLSSRIVCLAWFKLLTLLLWALQVTHLRELADKVHERRNECTKHKKYGMPLGRAMFALDSIDVFLFGCFKDYGLGFRVSFGFCRAGACWKNHCWFAHFFES